MQRIEKMQLSTPTRLLKPAAVQDRTTLDRVTIWRKVKDGTFPKPIYISVGRIAWREADIETFIERCSTSNSPSQWLQ
jgi:predicted DNA-binding transcriptional regulator AlpA